MPDEQTRRAGPGHSDRTVPKPREKPWKAHGREQTCFPRPAGDEMSRLKEVVYLQSQLQNRSLESDQLSASADLQRKLNQLEKEKLQFCTKFNVEVSMYEEQLAKLRAVVERGEARRQNLEYEMAALRKQAAAERNSAEEMVANLGRKHSQLQARSTELQQRASDLQRALAVAQQAREEVRRSLQTELEERERLLLSAGAENERLGVETARLKALLQDREGALLELCRKAEEIQRERDEDRQQHRRRAKKLQCAAGREGALRRQLEDAEQSAKSLEAVLESERAARLESEERVWELEAMLEATRNGQEGALSSLELMKQQLSDLEVANEQEQNKARNVQHMLTQLEKDYLSIKSEVEEKDKTMEEMSRAMEEKGRTMEEMSRAMEEKGRTMEEMSRAMEEKGRTMEEMSRAMEEKGRTMEEMSRAMEEKGRTMEEMSRTMEEKGRTMEEMSRRLEDCERQRNEVQQKLQEAERQQSVAQELNESFMRDLWQILHREGAAGPQAAGAVAEDMTQSPSELLESVKEMVHHYADTLEKMTNEVLDLRRLNEKATEEIKGLEDRASSYRKSMEDSHSSLAQALEELSLLRTRCVDSAALVDRAQEELLSSRRHCKLEQERSAAAEKELHELTVFHQQDLQEKLTSLHGLYQRLLVGRVLIPQQDPLLASFSWAELNTALQEQAAALTSDLSRANEKVSHLQGVCEKQGRAMRCLQQSQEATFCRLTGQLQEREEAWQEERRRLERRHGQQAAEASARVQKWQEVAETAQEKVAGLESIRNQMALDLARSQRLLLQAQQETAALLAACALLVGALGPLRWRLAALCTQKARLLELLAGHEAFEKEVASLVWALEPEDVAPPREQAGRGLRAFRKGAVVALAANRLRRLGEHSRLLFISDCGPTVLPALPVCALGARTPADGANSAREGQNSSVVFGGLNGRTLLPTVLRAMEGLQLKAPDTGSRLQQGAAWGRFSMLLEKLLGEAQSAPGAWIGGWGELVQRLGRGLRQLPDADPATLTRKRMVQLLQQHVLQLTHRLHRVEVERRSLRLELAQAKRDVGDKPDVDVPRRGFESVCHELQEALLRERQAQELLLEQAEQLRKLGLQLEVHCGEDAEKEHTLTEAVQSLSDAKAELRRKDQALRQLRKSVSQLQQNKLELERGVHHAERGLRAAARTKETLTSYMRSVAGCVKDVKARGSLSLTASPLWLPRVQLDPPEPDVDACQVGPTVGYCRCLVLAVDACAV
ncbi:coiled-coil domain-containing protein 171-like [Brienomyrus brachyistius]|uniref:coiled-coil domain-containing protein 171-like n=1 Tax=Brienomyrus brachyistius TaxID=42636 RepID=UPI0020B4476C|nr:coiled-coil domain-containing protein 171-like [Brienomyrus brachyistius]XP_048827103.1 coiled-coil domain-containing protein 171-like [Brienomyrus brachyistius]XP_048827104.1 coiled-coil domain-containing protein 171-like [Brienomyrus brachyistius]XP_048827105.1 coiled-coil domain-containing protein 171-like [Brienomyrus brachyistius]XP_048827106.1 coiled-coil domain-containing protein 171-like [Brienomyrus brachyistius]XP_048827107.1 coiled-coil domain-containing protein 171-like [Brienom